MNEKWEQNSVIETRCVRWQMFTFTVNNDNTLISKTQLQRLYCVRNICTQSEKQEYVKEQNNNKNMKMWNNTIKMGVALQVEYKINEKNKN